MQVIILCSVDESLLSLSADWWIAIGTWIGSLGVVFTLCFIVKEQAFQRSILFNTIKDAELARMPELVEFKDSYNQVGWIIELKNRGGTLRNLEILPGHHDVKIELTPKHILDTNDRVTFTFMPHLKGKQIQTCNCVALLRFSDTHGVRYSQRYTFKFNIDSEITHPERLGS